MCCNCEATETMVLALNFKRKLCINLRKQYLLDKVTREFEKLMVFTLGLAIAVFIKTV